MAYFSKDLAGFGGAPVLDLGEPAPVVAAVALPTITQFQFRNTGNSSANNCCRLCPTTLGVGRSGTASNGMEMIFTISGHRPGFNYDILRTMRYTLFQRRAGAWIRHEQRPWGTFDDRHADDECLTMRDGRLYVIDTPGYGGITLPAPAGTRFGSISSGPTAADATEVVVRINFAEWVIVKDFNVAGSTWQRIGTPQLRRWHTITWLRRNGAGQWVLDARSAIALGNIAERTIAAAP